MENKEIIIDEINNMTDNKYEFRLKSATLKKATGFCFVEIFYKDGILMNQEDSERVKKFIAEKIGNKFETKVGFIKDFVSEDVVLLFIRNYIENNFKSIIFETDKVEKTEDKFCVSLTIDNLSFDYAKDINLSGKIENQLSKRYSQNSFSVKLNSGKIYEEEIKIENTTDFEEEDESKYRIIEFSDTNNIVGEVVSPASYIVDKNVSEENATICGKISGINVKIIKRKPKQTEDNDASEENENCNPNDEEVAGELENNHKYERKMFRWTLEDFTGSMSCVFLSNKENAKLIEKLVQGENIAVSGKVERNKYSGDFEFFVKGIAKCSIPEGLKEFILYKKEKPYYEFVKPEPITIYSQGDFSTLISGEKKVPEYLKDKTFVCYDLETTGLHYEGGDRMVEIGAVKIVNGKITEKFVSYVNPDGRHIDEGASATTGIYDEDVADAPKDYEVLQDFYKFSRGSILIGYNNKNFDNAFLIGQGKKCRWNFDNENKDVYRLVQKYVRGVKNYRLGTVAEKLGVVLDNAHSAVYDALATAEVFIKIAGSIV